MAYLLTEFISKTVILSLVQNRLKGSDLDVQEREAIESTCLDISDEFIDVVHTIMKYKNSDKEILNASLTHKIQDFQQAFAETILTAVSVSLHTIITYIWVKIIERLEEELEDSVYAYAYPDIEQTKKNIITFSKKTLE